MTCKELQFELLSNNGNASAEGQKHLSQCHECRKFAHTLALSTHIEMSAEEQNTLRLVKHQIRHRSQVAAILRWLKYINCAAAAILLCFGLWYFTIKNDAPSQRPQPEICSKPVDSLITEDCDEYYAAWEKEYEIFYNSDLYNLRNDLDTMENHVTLLAYGL